MRCSLLRIAVRSRANAAFVRRGPLLCTIYVPLTALTGRRAGEKGEALSFFSYILRRVRSVRRLAQLGGRRERGNSKAKRSHVMQLTTRARANLLKERMKGRPPARPPRTWYTADRLMRRARKAKLCLGFVRSRDALGRPGIQRSQYRIGGRCISRRSLGRISAKFMKRV